MQTTIRCVLELAERRKPITFFQGMSVEEIIRKCMEKLDIFEEESLNFELFIPSINCTIELYEDLKEGDVIELRRKIYKDRASLEEQPNFQSIQQISLDDSLIISEIVSQKVNNKDWEENKDEYEDKKEIEEKKENNPQEKTEKYAHENPLDVQEIKNQIFENRNDLEDKVKKWASELGFKLIFLREEQASKLTKERVSELHCNKKDCDFFLRFRTQKDNGFKYVLKEGYLNHNHELSKKDGAEEMTPSIIERIKELKNVAKDIVTLTSYLNKELNKKFSPDSIRYQLSKLNDVEFGHVTEDANHLLKLLKQDSHNRGSEFETLLSEEGKLRNMCFMSPRMKSLVSAFCDVLFIDTTHKSNRFGLPLLDIIIVNNYGMSCTCFISLLENQKTESFEWALKNFARYFNKMPKVIYSDEEEALRGGKIFEVFCSFEDNII